MRFGSQRAFDRVESPRSQRHEELNRTKWIGGALVLAGAMLMNTAPAMAQDSGNAGGYNYAPAGQLDSLVSRIALYPDPLLAQIFAAAAFPDQIAAAAQGSGGPFDPSVEALMQYPSVLQMMASDPGWTQALGQAVMQDEGAVMDTIQNLRREAQQYGYLQSGPQMQVVDDGGYIDIMPVGGYMYVPMYDPYVVFARPRPGFFVGGAIRFGGGFRWVSGYNRFDWRRHEVFVNRRVWTPPVRGRTRRLSGAPNSSGSRTTGRTSRAAIANGTGTTRLRQCSLPHSALSLRSSHDASSAPGTSSVILRLLNNNRSSAALRLPSPPATSVTRCSGVSRFRGRSSSAALLLSLTMKAASDVAVRVAATGASHSPRSPPKWDDALPGHDSPASRSRPGSRRSARGRTAHSCL